MRALTDAERTSWDTAHAALCERGDATCSAHQPGNWWHLTFDALAAADAVPYSRPVAPVGGETAAPQNGGSTPPSGGTGLA